jgi:hypothetical protein
MKNIKNLMTILMSKSSFTRNGSVPRAITEAGEPAFCPRKTDKEKKGVILQDFIGVVFGNTLNPAVCFGVILSDD